MAEQFHTDGLTIAPGVVETILAQTVLAIDGVAQVGSPKATDGLFGSGKHRNPAQGILMTAEEGVITIAVHLTVFYGYQLQAVAQAVRQAVAEVLIAQIGLAAAAIDIYIDGIAFPE